MSEASILLDVADGIARLTLNRPEVGNAIDLEMARNLLAAAIRCQTDEAIRCVVLTGSGRLFCAGGDVGQMAAAGERADALLSELAGLLHMGMVRLARMKKPLVVLVNGPAAGAGLSLAISGDIVLSVPTAHYTAAYGAIGLTPDGGMSWLLPRLVGLRKAQEIILANRRVQAPEAEAIGLVSRLVEADQLSAEGDAVAKQLADSAVGAIGGARALLRQSFDSSYEAQLEREAQSISEAGATAECREGLAAFFAKRRPDFRSV